MPNDKDDKMLVLRGGPTGKPKESWVPYPKRPPQPPKPATPPEAA